MTKLRREKKLIPQEQKGLGDRGGRRFDTRSTADSEMSPTPTTRPALIFKALSPANSTGPLLDLQSGADDSSAPLCRSMDSSYPPRGADEKITENISYCSTGYYDFTLPQFCFVF